MLGRWIESFIRLKLFLLVIKEIWQLNVVDFDINCAFKTHNEGCMSVVLAKSPELIMVDKY